MSGNDKARQRRPIGPGRNKADTQGRHRAATGKRIRDILARTQVQLGVALGVSEKAVQSYEQGWRNVPVRVMIQLFVLLALYRKQSMDDVPCWEIRKCSPAQRDDCPSFTVGRGQFCWLIGSKNCRPTTKAAMKFLLPCMECPVVKRLLSGRRPMPGRVRR